mgnify:CR=1 FL=1
MNDESISIKRYTEDSANKPETGSGIIITFKDAYSFDERCAICWDENWKQSDAFFFDNPDIADKYGFITCYKGEPIGFICWDPRNRPEYVEIGHNGIKTKYKGKAAARIHQ